MKIVKGKRTKRTRHRLYFPIPSPQVSKNISVSSTEEEEDIAKCLILLAQGCFPKQENKEDDEGEKYSKREKTRISGFNIYNCKTCDRTFQSFQALGGHRASHNKPRIDPRKDQKVKIKDMKGQLNNLLPVAVKRTKVHECPVCGSEFNSDQSLGGHMRRHNKVPPKGLNVGDHKGIGFLAFDLNLPALIEDDQGQLIEPEYDVKAKKHLYFSSPALIDCHY